MKTFLTVVGGALLALSCVTASDARPHAKQQTPTQSGSGYDTTGDRDSSCFSRSTSLSDQYACSSHGG